MNLAPRKLTAAHALLVGAAFCREATHEADSGSQQNEKVNDATK